MTNPTPEHGPDRLLPRIRLDAVDALLGLALLAYALVYLSWLTFHWGGPELQTAIADGIYLPLGALVILIAVRASRASADPAVRRAWFLFAAAFTAYALGDLVWFVMEVVAGLEIPNPSLADLGYVAFYPLLAAGLLALPRTRRHGERMAALDLAIVCTGGAAAVWWLVVAPVAAATGSDLASTALALLYPAMDLGLLFALFAAVLGRVRGVPASSLLLLAAGLVCNIVADLAYARLALEASYTSGGWTDVAYTTGWIALGLAGLAQLRGTRTVDPEQAAPIVRSAGALPYLATAIVLGLVAASALAAPMADRVLIAGAIAVTALVSLRQLLTSRQITHLLARELQTEARTAEILRKASDAVVVVDRAGTITYATPPAQELAVRGATLVGRPLTDLVANSDAPLLVELLAAAAEPGGTTRTVPGHAAVAGRPLEVEMANLLDDPLVGGIVVTLRDVTERLAFESELRSLALHDPLTGLANRILFGDRLEQALSRAQRRRTRPAVLYLDLDDFKTVNDTLGHEAGDQVLVAVAQRIGAILRAEDTAARLGGDEFAVLLDETVDVEDAVAIAERIRKALSEPILVGERPLGVAASIGIVRSEARGDDKVVLLRNADIAMYEAKRETPGRHQVFTPRMYEHRVDRVRLEADMREALDAGQLEVVYQVLVALDEDRAVGIEALLRWRHPSRGVLLPATFVPLAESSGEIGRIGRWVLEEACRTVAAWNGVPGQSPLRANVNVSVRQLEPAFVDDVLAVLARTGLPAGRLVLEITESVFADGTSGLVDVLRTLRAHGVRIAIDDFGTGYSSLSYLRDLPVDELKVDRSFVSSMDLTSDQGLVATIIRIGRDLALDTVAEGIESWEQLEQLRRLGCTLGQGYLLGRPAPMGELPFLRTAADPVAPAAHGSRRAERLREGLSA